MKKLLLIFTCCLGLTIVQAQNKQYNYDTVPNDPLKARIYKLENGLTVMLTVYKDAPRIHTFIGTKAGSKNDPADATGLAHYLEHMLFKGTDQFGTKDFASEKPYLANIEELYETYRKTTDEAQRKIIYRSIDSLSGIAASYAIPNEYDKMIAALGAKSSNAYTSFDQTVYICDIPANQLNNWLMVESERFRNPVMRIFHTELEAVYEEKNRSLDDDNSKIWESLFEMMFPTHPYGTQTTIGTIEHLKNPSLKKITEYYNTYYVPNNMAICLSGDFDPQATIELIDRYFGKWKSKPLPSFQAVSQKPLGKREFREVVGPGPEQMAIAYRVNGASSMDADLIKVINRMLFNNTAGLIDINLNQSQKVLSAGSFDFPMKEYSLHILMGEPKEGQSLAEIEKLLAAQAEKIAKGDFPDWLLEAALNDIKKERLKTYETNEGRANALLTSFVYDIPWKDQINEDERLSKITREQIIAFAKKTYLEGKYGVIFKVTGEDKNVQKVVKPEITPVALNRDDKSVFMKAILSNNVPDIEPVFIDFKKDLVRANLKNQVELVSVVNKENELFDLYYVWDFGKSNNKNISLALEYLKYLGTSRLSPEKINQEFYKLGSVYNIDYTDDRIIFHLQGLDKNLKATVSLFEELLNDPRENESTLSELKNDVLKKRSDARLNKDIILDEAMFNYGLYGSQNPFTHILDEKSLNSVSSASLINEIKALQGIDHRFMYYGPSSVTEVTAVLNEKHKAGNNLKPVSKELVFKEQENENTKVYVVPYDMKQAEILLLSKKEKLNKTNIPTISLFSEYFGGGMGSIVFQTLRESKALAYSTFAMYQSPNDFRKSHYVSAYIGTQADKLPEAMQGMMELLSDLPRTDNFFEASKNAVIQKIRTERITKRNILLAYERNKKMGFDYDYRKDIFTEIPSMKFETIDSFHKKYIKNSKYNIMVLGNKENLDIPALEKYGPVKYLTLTDVFGY